MLCFKQIVVSYKRANALSRSYKHKQLVSGCSCVQGETTPPVPCHFLSLSRRLVPFFVVFVLALTRSTARKRSKLTAKRLTTRCSREPRGAGCDAALKRSTDLVCPFCRLANKLNRAAPGPAARYGGLGSTRPLQADSSSLGLHSGRHRLGPGSVRAPEKRHEPLVYAHPILPYPSRSHPPRFALIRCPGAASA